MTFWVKTLFQGTSPYNGEVKVTESFGERRLIAAGYTQSRSLNKDGLTGSYWDGFIKNIPELNLDSRVLMLGLGGGTGVKLLTTKFGLVAIDAVEIDPLMVELAKKYLDLKEKNVNIVVEDALKFVKEARYKYDLICVDLFSRGGVAVGAESKHFFQTLKGLLNEGGVVAINKLFTTHEDLQNYVSFLKQVFAQTQCLLVHGALRADNVIVYCSL